MWKGDEADVVVSNLRGRGPLKVSDGAAMMPEDWVMTRASHLTHCSVNTMGEIWPHPYFEPHVDVGRVWRDTMRVCLKSAAEMVYGDNPPAWVLILDEHLLFYPRRSRVVLNGVPILDCELIYHDDLAQYILAPADAARLQELLGKATEDSFRDAHTQVIDGHPCFLTVINGVQKWIAVCEFNLAGMPDPDRMQPGPSIAEILVRYSGELAVCR